MKTIAFNLITIIMLSGCFLLPAKRDTHALLINMTPEVKLEIEQIISATSGGQKIIISETTFTKDSLLIMERSPLSGKRHTNDRTKNPPNHYRLIISDNGQCFISDESTKLQWFLFKGHCKVEL